VHGADLELAKTRGFLVMSQGHDKSTFNAWLINRNKAQRPIIYIAQCGLRGDLAYLGDSFIFAPPSPGRRQRLNTKVALMVMGAAEKTGARFAIEKDLGVVKDLPLSEALILAKAVTDATTPEDARHVAGRSNGNIASSV